ncbi:MAG: WD40 repeat domain-containing protein, partial [Blastocatellia bacterium]
TAQLVAELKGHSAYVWSAAYSPDGKFIVTASADRTARVWNASTAQLVAELKGHSAYVWSAAYSPDGKFIVTASGDQTARIYPRVTFMPFDELLELARKLSPRELTPEERERYLHEPQSKRKKKAPN